MTTTPELDKQLAIIKSGRAATVQEFYDWLQEQEIVLAKWDDDAYTEPRLFPFFRSPEDLMADFFGIDRDKIEAERQMILDELRATANG